MRLTATAFALVAALVTAAGATTWSETASGGTLVIRAGRSIGKFELGMTQRRLVRVAGRPSYVIPRGSSFGRRTVEYQYGAGAEYIVRLFGLPGRMVVTRVSTNLRSERTRQGIGAGSLERAVRRAFPALRCDPLEPFGVVRQYVFNTRECALFSGRGTRTIFRTSVPNTNYGVTAEEFVRKAVVIEVVVSAR